MLAGLLALIGLCAVVGWAAAASQVTTTSGRLGTRSVVVASCQTTGTIVLRWGTPAFNPGANPHYQASSILASGLNASCNSKKYTVFVVNGSNASIASGSGTLPGSGSTATLAVAPTVNLTNAAKVVLTIRG